VSISVIKFVTVWTSYNRHIFILLLTIIKEALEPPCGG